MKLTIDANILFASLIRDSTTRKLIFNPVVSLFAPQFILEELLSHRPEIQKKSKLNDEELSDLVGRIVDQISVIADKELKPFLPAAASLSTDEKDWLYIACALREDTWIWSHDAGFAPQKRVKIVTTKELASIVGLI
jgi:predicted nucleic acid-binding protein